MAQPRPLDGNYEAVDIVSVWIGSFPNEAAFDEYLKEDYEATDEDDFSKCHFWEDLGIRWHDHDFQEAVFRGDAVQVEELVAKFSWIGSYKASLLKRCSELGITHANAAIVICEYDYPPAAEFHSPNLTFVGSFRYSTGGYTFRRNPS